MAKEQTIYLVFKDAHVVIIFGRREPADTFAAASPDYRVVPWDMVL